MAGVVNQAKKGLQSAFLGVKWLIMGKTGCFQGQYELVALNLR